MTTAVSLAQGASNNVTMRNRIINGAMVIDQRNAGASVSVASTAFGYVSVDRWRVNNQTDGALTLQRSTVAPAGFSNSLLATVTTADTSLGASQFCFVQQPIEGFNVSDFGFGTSNATSVTLSFWVRSSVTGTMGGTVTNGAINRSYPFTYTISAANTWEQKTVTLSGDTTGTWATDNSAGMNVFFSLGCGTDNSGTAGAWAGAQRLSATGATSVVGTNGATFYITGVQLEAGTTATPFEQRLYGTELALCQRYYQRWNTGASGSATWGSGLVTVATGVSRVGATLSVPMRSSPTFNYSNARLYDGAAPTVTSILTNACTATNMNVDLAASGGGLTTARFAALIELSSTGYVDFSAEL